MTALALALLLVLGAGGCTPQKKGSAGILYRVTGGKSDLYLLGSIHVGSEEMYPMGPHILDAMEAADVLAFECDTASAQAQAAYQELMRCPEGDTLESRVSADTYALVRQAAQKAGYRMDSLNALKPWAVMSMLNTEAVAATLEARGTKASAALGVEEQVRKLGGGKPEAWLDVPIDVSDYEIIDLFNWQNSVKDMISQIEFVRMVDVQSETVERYIKDGKVKPDLSIPFGDKRMFHYFREESIRNIAKQYGWDLITPQNMADKFMKFIETMDMSYFYKPVLLKAIYEYMDTSGRVALPDVVGYFIDFYEDRKAHGMIAEKSTSIYQKGGYTRKDVEKNILSNPFKRFEDMRFLMRCKDVETIEVNPIIFRKLTREDWLHIVDVCDKSLEKYYLRLKK